MRGFCSSPTATNSTNRSRSRKFGGRQRVYLTGRIESARTCWRTLNATPRSQPPLICSLIHKFRHRRRWHGFAETMRPTKSSSRSFAARIPKDFSAKGNIFVFVDEAHRTQTGKMHEAMKQLLPNAMFIGFTGTPLLSRQGHQHRDVRQLHSHLQVRRGSSRMAWCSTCATRPATSTRN